MIARAWRIVPVLVSLAAFGEPLTVTVTNVDGEPAAGAEVFCVRWHDSGCRIEPLPDGARQIADDNGQATFDVEGPEQYILYGRQGWFGVHGATDEFGTIYMGDAFSGGTDFGMRRFGADWVVVWVGSTVIS